MKLLIFILVCSFSQYSYSECREDKKVLFFANGMFNSRIDAKDSLEKLISEYAIAFPDEKFDDFQIAYNTDEPALLQVFQVYRQKVEETGLGFWTWVGNFTGLEYDAEFQKKIAEFNSEQRAHDQDLKIQIEQYNKYIKNEFQIVTVAHSQGNFYTLFAFNQIGSPLTKMVSVATPAGKVYKDGPYYTFMSDGVVSHIPGALEPNRQKSPPGYFDHRFVDDYLLEPGVGNEILNSVSSATEDFDSTEPSLRIEDGYFNKDMEPIITWFNDTLGKKINPSAADCMVAYGLFSIYRLHNRTCGDRNLRAFKISLNGCILDRQDTERLREETACPFYAGMDMINPFAIFYPDEQFDFFQNNPFCDMGTLGEYEEKVNIKDLQEALSRF